MKRAIVPVALLVAGVVATAPGGGAAAPVAWWNGTLTVPRDTTPVPVSVRVAGATATVSLGPGHAAWTKAKVRRASGRLLVTIPGRPPLVLDGRIRGGELVGTTRQGTARGTFALGRATRPGAWSGHGVFRLQGGDTLAVAPLAETFTFGVRYERSEIRQLAPRARGWTIGAGVLQTTPSSGVATVDGPTVRWRGEQGTRLPVRQLEVRFPSGRNTLAGTLWLPAGRGPHPAVAVVHGSGAVTRAEDGVFASFFASRGIAVLRYDKRGIGQSGGLYPGESAGATEIDSYARDAAAAARFLTKQPEIDRQRLGLAGRSQAGWIMPHAAVREPAIRFLVVLAGPTVTQGESDRWGRFLSHGDAPGDLAAAEQAVRADGPSGVDPMPSIRKLKIPAIWVYGGVDRHVPTELCVERLQPVAGESGRDFSILTLPRANHGFIDSSTGLNTEAGRSHQFAAGLFSGLQAWLAEHGLIAHLVNALRTIEQNPAWRNPRSAR